MTRREFLRVIHYGRAFSHLRALGGDVFDLISDLYKRLDGRPEIEDVLFQDLWSDVACYYGQRCKVCAKIGSCGDDDFERNCGFGDLESRLCRRCAYSLRRYIGRQYDGSASVDAGTSWLAWVLAKGHSRLFAESNVPERLPPSAESWSRKRPRALALYCHDKDKKKGKIHDRNQRRAIRTMNRVVRRAIHGRNISPKLLRLLKDVATKKAIYGDWGPGKDDIFSPLHYAHRSSRDRVLADMKSLEKIGVLRISNHAIRIVGRPSRSA